MMKLSPAIFKPDGHRAAPLIWKPTEETLTYQKKVETTRKKQKKQKSKELVHSVRVQAASKRRLDHSPSIKKGRTCFNEIATPTNQILHPG
jgi:hypothetical protein